MKERAKFPRAKWTPKLDARLAVLWKDHTTAECAAIMGMREYQIHNRQATLRLPNHHVISRRNQPPEGAFYEEATRQAALAGLRVVDVVGGAKTSEAAYARGLAFKQILARYPNSTKAGVARESGLDVECVRRCINRVSDPDGIRSIGEVIEQHNAEIVGVDA